MLGRTNIPDQAYGNPPFAVTIFSSTAGLPVTVTVQSGPAKISRGLLTLTGVGVVTLAANQPGNANYAPADEVTTSFYVAPGSQTIAPFKPIGPVAYGTAPLIAAPAATSNLPVVVSVLSGPARITNGTLELIGVGTVVLAADQPGNANYAAAPEVTTSVTVSKGTQTIGPFARIPPRASASGPFNVSPPLTSSGLPVNLSIKSGPATINGYLVTLTGSGEVVIAADQPGNENYDAAQQVTTSFRVR